MSSHILHESKLLRFAFKNSPRLTAIIDVSGDVIQFLKHGFHADLSTLAGALFLLSGLALWHVYKHPAVIKIASLLTMTGCVALVGSYHGTAGFHSQILGVLPIVVSMTLLMMNAKKPSRRPAKNLPFGFTNLWRLVCAYPIFSGSLFLLAGKPLLLVAAVYNGDVAQIATVISWSIGDASLGLTDQALQEKIKSGAIEISTSLQAA